MAHVVSKSMLPHIALYILYIIYYIIVALFNLTLHLVLDSLSRLLRCKVMTSSYIHLDCQGILLRIFCVRWHLITYFCGRSHVRVLTSSRRLTLMKDCYLDKYWPFGLYEIWKSSELKILLELKYFVCIHIVFNKTSHFYDYFLRLWLHVN